MQHMPSQQIKMSHAKHQPFLELQAIHLSLHGSSPIYSMPKLQAHLYQVNIL
jgi:hypothetical protein